MSAVDLINRVRKNARHLKKWARREGTSAYRVYDRDIPEHPYTVDRYAGRVLCVYYPPRSGRSPIPDEVVRAGLADALDATPEHVFLKVKRAGAVGPTQYERLDETGERFPVEEGGLTFLVNLSDYIDTGLFLDHRPTRARVRAEAKGKRFLNLFSYTGAFTVHAAAGGASHTTSVDLSQTYLDWTRENLRANDLEGPQHVLVRDDARAFLTRRHPEPYDLVVLDPPSHSRSKKMHARFDIIEDHPALLVSALRLVAPGGALYFSTNQRGFTLSPAPVQGFEVEELSPGSIPDDVRDKEIHRLWRIVRPAS